MRHLVFLFLNRLTCPLASESGRTSERNISSWSKVSILALSVSNLFFSLLGESYYMGSQYKKVNAKMSGIPFMDMRGLELFSGSR